VTLQRQYHALMLLFSKHYVVTKTGTVFRYKNDELVKLKGEKKEGYKRVELYGYDGSRYRFMIHQLVWLSYRGLIPKGLCLNHKDGKRWNNNLKNLELVTPLENNLHAIRIGRRALKISDRNAEDLRHLASTGVSAATLARCYKIDRSYVRDIIQNKARTLKHGIK
jgi:ribosomal protein L28